ncbi:MAG: hypothetical protein DRG20_04550 [Deltaproteobacteria bacterium]|nr:YkgJ family cysteine cluster protein [Deltaproteobacteria bacterium]RLA89537.1 MAG: hypothetical protein DRG20_04550 [Deltaproteobacteria bacterium]
MNNKDFSNYLNLIKGIESITSKIKEKYKDDIQCKEGCDECCNYHLSLFPIEAYYLKKGFESLRGIERDILLNKCINIIKDPNYRGPCPLLEKKRCLLYEYRPIICRTQGYPLFSLLIDENEDKISYCPKNFKKIKDRKLLLEEKMVLDLDTINKILVTINGLFVNQYELKLRHPNDRILIAQAIVSID